jgi:exodeoxyribonuclease-3
MKSKKGDAPVKIVTWNVNGLRAVVQKGFYEFWEAQSPDFLCLQETKCHPDQLQDALSSPLGWKSFWSSAQRPGYSGTVTFSRETPERVDHGIDIPKFDAEGRLVVTQFKDFTLYNCYFPNGGSGQERHDFKQEFLNRFSYHLQKRVAAGENVIVVGDYNVAYLDIDVYDPKALSSESGFLPEEREWMRHFLEKGFIDGFRYFHPEEKHRYTWWSYFQNARVGNRGWRIDHICVSRGLEKKIKAVEILDRQEGSDHCPVVMEIDL